MFVSMGFKGLLVLRIKGVSRAFTPAGVIFLMGHFTLRTGDPGRPAFRSFSIWASMSFSPDRLALRLGWLDRGARGC